MKNLFRMAALLLIVAALAACTRTKEAALADMEELYNKTSAKCSQYTAKDWSRFEKELQDIEADLAKYELSAQEKIQLGKLRVKCAALSVQGKAVQAKEAAADAAEDVSKAAKKAANEISDAVEDAADNISDAAKDFKKAMEK